MKKRLIAGILATTLVAPSQAQTDMQALHKELKIMSNIMKTALTLDAKDKGIRMRGVEATYLADQGVVFEVTTSNGGWNFDIADLLSDVPIPPVPDLPSVHFITSEDEMVIDIQEEIEDATRSAFESARGEMRKARNKLRNLREQEREYAWEQREYDRRLRDIDFQKRSADKTHLSQLEQNEAELRQELEEIKRKREEIAKYSEQLEVEHKALNEKRIEARQQTFKAFLAKFESGIGDVLCNYGAGLKSLPKEQNVSFVLDKFGQVDDQSSRSDRIYVFKQKDINACVINRISTDELLTRATIYDF
ncbi:hypothetical protein OE749_09605 [Aestuariibacter sp. AA17]|uniref:Uncharacterized protein n=1 Tax=Fluctibacter corallii TaxID=2984329 RepID=A0ABT3A8F4_9ALTE|nr:hypothetical protein [Aestuariibacter sp. AA17]MCV2884951.1 hypothetical protein [Aestuariibacter sp. AA17]